MAILGYDVKSASQVVGIVNDRIVVSKHSLASAATLTELHCWVAASDPSNSFRIAIYADNGSGAPGARVAYTNALHPATSPASQDKSQTGFSVALTAGDYWIGWHGILDWDGSCNMFGDASGWTHALKNSVSNPPPDPFGTPTSTGAIKLNAWAVVTPAAGAAFVPTVTIIG